MVGNTQYIGKQRQGKNAISYLFIFNKSVVLNSLTNICNLIEGTRAAEQGMHLVLVVVEACCSGKM